MKRANFLGLALIGMMAVAGPAGCKKGPKPLTPIPNSPTTVPDNSQPFSPQGGNSTRPGLPGQNNGVGSDSIRPSDDGTLALGSREERGNFIVDRDTFKAQTVYFDYDRSNVKSGEYEKLRAVSAFLKSNPTFRLEVEGHCDERGTPEYNRALGERRALSAREVLGADGIPAESMSTISFGEDKPAVLGFDEDAYAKNRRAEFVLLKPKQ